VPRTLGVHEVNADGVVVEAVVLDDVVAGEHEVNRVATAAPQIVAEDILVGIPGDHVARVDDFVFLDEVVVAVPKAQTIAAHTQFEILRLDAVAAHDAVVDLLEVDAEQTVVDHVVFDHVVIATYIEAGVVGIVRVAGTGQAQAANDRIAGIQHHDRPLSPASMVT
jgi:hypothetical protein